LRKEKKYDAICIAGFGPTKGIDVLIEAAKLLKTRDRGIRLLHVGGGPRMVAEPYERQLADSCVEEVLTFAGVADSDQVRDYLSQSAISVLPAVVTDDGHMDGLPVALMEAAAMELPLISTDVAGIPELVIDGVTGLIVPQRNPRALAEAIETLLHDDELRERLGRAARQRVLEEFTREMNGERLLTVLRPYIQET
jgi:glycosyltransferase involved in cell wall biosynthesis